MGKTFNMVGGGSGGGTTVVANPTLTGTELDLKGLEVSGTKYKVPLIRPNLLDNWYFVGGGSQQGGGQFPINQKGATSYSGNNVYAIDRWRSAYANASISIVSNGMKVQTNATVTGATRFADSNIENYKRFEGKTITFSVLVSEVNGSQIAATLRFLRNGGVYNPMVVLSSVGLLKTTVPASEIYSITELRVTVASRSAATANSNVVIAAMKLELGDTQTLAHNEGTEANPVWVLNELPDYTEELWKCQRYYQLFANSAYRPTYGEDCRPPMRTHTPSQGTISIGGTTYYYNDSNL